MNHVNATCAMKCAQQKEVHKELITYH